MSTLNNLLLKSTYEDKIIVNKKIQEVEDEKSIEETHTAI